MIVIFSIVAFTQVTKYFSFKSLKKSSSQNLNLREFVIINGTRIDPNQKLKEKALLKKYVDVGNVDYARHPEKVPHTERQKAVIEACTHAWDGYRKSGIFI